MWNRQVVGLGAVVLGIVLAAGLGIRSASSWLSRSTPTRTNQDGIVSVGANSSGRDNRLSSEIEADSSQRNNRTDEQVVSQANNTTSAQSLSSLEEAGTYIQRQQRVNQDSVIANTPVEIIPTATAPVASQNNTRVSNQPSAPEPVIRATNPAPTVTSTTPAPAASPAVSEPVPALW